MLKHNFGHTVKLQSAFVVTLDIRSRSSKSSLKAMYLCKFGGEKSTGSEDSAQKRLI